MAIASIIVKIMPSAPGIELSKLKEEAKRLMEEEGAMNVSFEENPIAFGLVAIMMKFAWKEEKDTDIVEKKLSEIENVSSATITDYRRAFG